MAKNIFSSKPGAEIEKQKGLLTLELSEVREISDLIFRKLEKKMQVLEAMEASIDKKMAALERMILRAETLRTPGAGMNRQHEILALKERGLQPKEIAEVLDMPVGEAELILELHAGKS